MSTPATILKDTFGYDRFFPLQEDVIKNILSGKDTLAVMPTGGGKSLCYQIPALMLEGLTIVVSPLISLMKDQVDQLRANGVYAVTLNSSLSPEIYQENLQWIENGTAKLLYVAPESLMTPRILSLLSKLKVSLITIDEAHCISEWGHDFRPEYRQLVSVRQQFPDAVCLALTATATTRVRSDIIKNLNFQKSNEFIASFDRKNLYIEVIPKENQIKQLGYFLENFKDQSGIIYCFSRRQVDELSAYLSSQGLSVLPYHAGLSDAERKANQEAFIRDNVQIIVATIAFGMGINKPNVRFVVHYDLPKSIESYYQEIGRAGRDGLPAHCLLFYSYSDVVKINYFIKQKVGSEKLAAEQHLDAMVQFAEDQNTCRRKPLLNYFGEKYTQTNCSNCDNCKAEAPILQDITVPVQKFLSCVKRCDEGFGAAHITDVLRGSKAEKVLQHGHDKLSTYGIGTDLSKKQWMHLSRQLLQMGYLSQNPEFRTLSLTPKAINALKQRTTIMGQLMEADKSTGKTKTPKSELEYNQELFAILREKRKTIADEREVPPYVIFSDKSLIEMSSYYPQTKEDFLKINGVGQVKLNEFGDTFLAIISGFCKDKGISSRKPVSNPGKPSPGLRTMLIGQAFNNGMSIPQLMAEHKLKQGTIINHLEKFVLDGNPLTGKMDFSELLTTTDEQIQKAIKAFDELGTAFLKPIFEKLNGEISYDDLRVLRLYYTVLQSEKQKL
jgi:ATP-dependent DNA helicase RecQ